MIQVERVPAALLDEGVFVTWLSAMRTLRNPRALDALLLASPLSIPSSTHSAQCHPPGKTSYRNEDVPFICLSPPILTLSVGPVGAFAEGLGAVAATAIV